MDTENVNLIDSLPLPRSLSQGLSLWKVVLDATGDSLLFVAPDGILLDINVAGAVKFGLQSEDLVGTSLYKYISL